MLPDGADAAGRMQGGTSADGLLSTSDTGFNHFSGKDSVRSREGCCQRPVRLETESGENPDGLYSEFSRRWANASSKSPPGADLSRRCGRMGESPSADI